MNPGLAGTATASVDHTKATSLISRLATERELFVDDSC